MGPLVLAFSPFPENIKENHYFKMKSLFFVVPSIFVHAIDPFPDLDTDAIIYPIKSGDSPFTFTDVNVAADLLDVKQFELEVLKIPLPSVPRCISPLHIDRK